MKSSLRSLLLTGWIVVVVVGLALAGCGNAPVGSATPPASATAPAVIAPAATNPAAATTVAGVTAPAASPSVDMTDKFVNPVLRANYPDPFILQEGDTFYMYATNGASKNVQLATSTDLVHWEIKTDAMPSLPSWAQLGGLYVWAPEVIKLGETYNLYFVARDKKVDRQCVGVATSAKPQGKFKDTRSEPLVCQAKEGGTIDPSPFKDGDKLYLLYKNDGNCCSQATWIYIQEMAPDGLSLLGEPVRLIRNDKPWEGIVIEAPTMIKHEERYYLFYSANNYAGFEYAVGYAVCDTPAGPCQKAAENPILKSVLTAPPVIGPGHQDIVELGSDFWLVYHAWEVNPRGTKTDRRLVWIDKLEWVDGKPVVRGPTEAPQPDPVIPK